MSRPLAALFAAALLSGCGFSGSASVDPATIPTPPIEAAGAEATGPVVELGTGVDSGAGWRLSTYPTADGTCIQLDTVSTASGSCGPPPTAPDAFGIVVDDVDLGNGAGAVAGTVTADVATVFLVDEDQGLRLPARLLPMGDGGPVGSAFVAFPPELMTPTHLLALAPSGEILETYELP